MSTNTWKLIDGNIILLNKDTGNQSALKHSIIVNRDLSYKYWDYLAWSVAAYRDRDVLSIGYGAGTFAQLLSKWGIGSKGIGVEIDEFYKEIPNKNEDYRIEYCDFRDYLLQVESRYDTIIVDVYDEKGYVDDAYDTDWIKKYLSLRKNKGKVVFHCMDIIGSIIAANIPVPQTPTVLSTMVERIRKVTNEDIYIIPMWSSYLLWVGPPPHNISTEHKPLKWVDEFFKSRMNKIDKEESIPQLNKPWTYEKLQIVNKSIVDHLGNSNRDIYNKFIDIMGPILQNKLTNKQLDQIINQLKETKQNELLDAYSLSFLYAMREHWAKALETIKGYKLPFAGWVQ